MVGQNIDSLLVQADLAARSARSAVLRTHLPKEQVDQLQRLLDDPVLLGLLELRIKGYTSLNRSRLLALHRFVVTSSYRCNLGSGQTFLAEAIRLTPSGWLTSSKHVVDCAQAMSAYRCCDEAQGICATAERISSAVQSNENDLLRNLVFWSSALRQIPSDYLAKPKRAKRDRNRVDALRQIETDGRIPALNRAVDRVHPFAEILIQEG